MNSLKDAPNVITAKSRGHAARFDNLRDNLRDVPGLYAMVLLANDGIALCGYGMPRADVQTNAAACSGVASLLKGASETVNGGDVLHTNVTMAEKHLVITSCGDGSTLVVFTDVPGNIGIAMREVVRVARAFSRQMGTEARPDATVQ